jgi:hypothetical protein
MKKRTFLFLALLVYSLHLFNQTSSAACVCTTVIRTPASEYAAASAVFVGTVKDIVLAEDSTTLMVRFNVEEAFKGVTGIEATVQTDGNPEGCGYQFVRGEKYLVYAFGSSLLVHKCSRTRPIAAAGEDLQYLRSLTKQPVIKEDFSQSAINFQVVLGGKWSVANEKYVLTSAASCSLGNGNISVHKTNINGDFILEAEASAVPTTGHWDDFSILFGYKDQNNYYFASFNESNDPNTNGIFRVLNEKAIQIRNFDATTTASSILHKIKVQRTGSTINVYRNGILLGSATDSTFTTGLVGFGTRNNNAVFDNLVVTQ